MALKTRYSLLQKFSVDKVFVAFSELPPMRRILVLAVVGSVILLILFLPLSLPSVKIESQRQVRFLCLGRENLVHNKHFENIP